MQLETERLSIRPIAPEDKHQVFGYRSDVEANKYQGWIPQTIDDVEEFISKVANQINEPESWFQMVILERGTDDLIGDIGIHFFGAENQQVEIGCTLNKTCQGKGYATEALKRVIDYLFTDLGKHRIITSIDPQNSSSIQLVERIGFRKEAHFVKSLFLNGQWVDDIIYALIEEDWKE